MNYDLIDHVATTIRRVDSKSPADAYVLADAIVGDLPKLDTDDRAVAAAVDALVADGLGLPVGGGTLSRDDLANIARIVFRSLVEG